MKSDKTSAKSMYVEGGGLFISLHLLETWDLISASPPSHKKLLKAQFNFTVVSSGLVNMFTAKVALSCSLSSLSS